jgi:hypothetical protein
MLSGLAVSVSVASARSLEQETTSVRHAISWQRERTWHWQHVAGASRSPTIRGAGVWHSVGYLHWIERRWNRRRVAAYKLAHRPRPTYGRRRAAIDPRLICRVFGAANCSDGALDREDGVGFSTNPQPPNPTHFGIFQLDASAIAAYARGRYRRRTTRSSPRSACSSLAAGSRGRAARARPDVTR